MQIRVLVAEDETPLAMEIVEVLQEHGCVVVGPYSKSKDVIVAAQTEAIDMAILDINLRGGDAFAAAHALQKRDIPFFFATGRDDLRFLPPNLRSVSILEKPYGMEELTAFVRALPAGIATRRRSGADQSLTVFDEHPR